MNTIKGPAIFLAQFVSEKAPFNSLKGLCEWVKSLGYKAIQIPTWESALIDLKLAAESQVYADELKGTVASFDLEISELSTHLQGQLVAVHPAYAQQFDHFAAEEVRAKPDAQQKWATEQVKMGAKASQRLGLSAMPTFSGALLWPYFYLWPQRSAGLVETGFAELAKRWLPILNYADECGVDLAYELHPGEDLHDGVSYERFLEAVHNHNRANLLYDPSHFVLQQLDYLAFIDIYHEHIKAFHVKDAEFNPSGRQGVYGGFTDWIDRAGRFRSIGDGQVDFGSIFTKLTEYDFTGWAVLEWECCLKHPEDGAKEGAKRIRNYIIRVTDRAFDDFAGQESDQKLNRSILGLD